MPNTKKNTHSSLKDSTQPQSHDSVRLNTMLQNARKHNETYQSTTPKNTKASTRKPKEKEHIVQAEYLNDIAIKKLPREAKIASVHVLRKEYGMSYNKIAKTMGISSQTAMVYWHEDVDEQYDQYQIALKKLFKAKEDQLLSKTMQYMDKKMPQAQFFQLVGAYKTIKEAQQPKGPDYAQQINIGGDIGINFVKKKNKYSDDTVDEG